MASAPPPRAEFFNLYVNPSSEGLPSIDAEVIAKRKQLLKNVEVLLSSASMHKELRMHFVGTLSSWENVSLDGRSKLLRFLKADPRSIFSLKLMQLVCARKPAEVAHLLSDDDRLFRRFFDRHPERIKAWFAHFSFPGPFEKGALAIERYAMTYRDEFWNRMVWLYSTAPSPVVIAHQKIRFLELDVVRTVQLMAESEGAFWTSEFFRNSLEGGDILAIDSAYFADELCRRVDSSRVWALAEETVLEEPMRELCHRLLLDLDEASVLQWLYRLVPTAGATPEQLLITEAKWGTQDEALMYTALLTQSKPVMKLLTDERPDDHRALLALVAGMLPTSEEDRRRDAAVQAALERETLGDGSRAYAKLVITVSFVMRATLVSFFADRSSLQTIYRQEGLNAEIVFEKALPRTDRPRDRKKRHREEEDEPIFIGWRLPGVALAFGVRDACQTVLPELFIRRAAERLAKR